MKPDGHLIGAGRLATVAPNFAHEKESENQRQGTLDTRAICQAAILDARLPCLPFLASRATRFAR